MFAYSSIEHMGLMTFAFGMGGPIANFAGLLHMTVHSLVKSAIFIREFVTKPWVHLDIAGTAYFRKTAPYAPRGATGASHATLVELALAGAKA